MAGVAILIFCLLRSLQLTYQSKLLMSRYFWLASVLVFCLVIRRELNFLPKLFIPDGKLWLGHGYKWWEHSVLFIVYLMTLGLLLRAWRYTAAVLKNVPISLYLIVAGLAMLQYLGENHILISEAIGVMVEEVSEDLIYMIALIYLLRFGLSHFNQQLLNTDHRDGCLKH